MSCCQQAVGSSCVHLQTVVAKRTHRHLQACTFIHTTESAQKMFAHSSQHSLTWSYQTTLSLELWGGEVISNLVLIPALLYVSEASSMQACVIWCKQWFEFLQLLPVQVIHTETPQDSRAGCVAQSLRDVRPQDFPEVEYAWAASMLCDLLSITANLTDTS